jgi:hypothetical protein
MGGRQREDEWGEQQERGPVIRIKADARRANHSIRNRCATRDKMWAANAGAPNADTDRTPAWWTGTGIRSKLTLITPKRSKLHRDQTTVLLTANLTPMLDHYD